MNQSPWLLRCGLTSVSPVCCSKPEDRPFWVHIGRGAWLQTLVKPWELYISAVSISAFSIPAVSIPAFSMSSFSIPAVSIPAFSVSSLSIPAVSISAFSISAVSIPAVYQSSNSSREVLKILPSQKQVKAERLPATMGMSWLMKRLWQAEMLTVVFDQKECGPCRACCCCCWLAGWLAGEGWPSSQNSGSAEDITVCRGHQGLQRTLWSAADILPVICLSRSPQDPVSAAPLQAPPYGLLLLHTALE